MATAALDNAAARRLFLARHALGEPTGGALTKVGLGELIDRLGFVQVDSISTVERAHHMILWARRSAYRPSQLTALLERDRALFEHWTHDAAVIPTRFFPWWRTRFARDAERLAASWRKWQGADCLAEAEAVLAHIRERGPALSREVGEARPRGPGGWWEWKPSKTALEYHWRTGALAVARREGFQKVFDLTERVIPEAHRSHAPDHAETVDWACGAALDRLGFATSGEIAAFWELASPAEAAAWCAAKRAAGEIVEVSVGTADGRARKVFARPDVDEAAAAAPEPPGRLRVLSPFDPALRDRLRVERLFGFSFRIEVFTPEPKRRYGYYVFPLLERARLVGRIDMRRRREADALAVRAVWPEPGLRFDRARRDRLDAELARVARFCGVGRVAFEDGWLREPLPPED